MRDRFLTDQFYDGPSTMSGKARYAAKLKWMRSRFGGVDDLHHKGGCFKCVHCAGSVSLNPLLSGVNNRNHCPYCLWSRHLDLGKAGDRLSACKAPMQPEGLTVKRSFKKYGQGSPGELMLIHRCVECEKLSINRIAADDDLELALEIFERSFQMDLQMRKRFEASWIEVLGAKDLELVRARLLGWTDYAPLAKTFA